MRMPRGGSGRAIRAFVAVIGMLVSVGVDAQTPAQAIRDLSSPETATRLLAARRLKELGALETALPLVKAITDPQDEVQTEAIAAELNIFLAEKVVPRKRVGLIIEVRYAVGAETTFSAGPLAIGPTAPPPEVLTALRAAARDDNPRVGLEALYAFGALAVAPGGPARREVLRTSGPDVAAMIGAADVLMRFAAIRVIGRIFEWRPEDGPIEPTVGDAVIAALNDKEGAIRIEAMRALGAMRYDRSVQALSDLFQYYGKGELAEAALDAIARIGHASSADLLRAQAASKSATLKTSAIEGLARLADPKNAPVVDVALNGERTERLLFAGAFAAATLSGGPIDPIVDALDKPRLRDHARQYLAELASWRSAAFAPYLTNPQPRIRIDVVDALGLGHDPSALPFVEPLLTDPDLQVARAAGRAAARLRASERVQSR